jgi:hypothetical protein
VAVPTTGRRGGSAAPRAILVTRMLVFLVAGSMTELISDEVSEDGHDDRQQVLCK